MVARGKSGRIVLEIDPEKKKGLYIALSKNQLTLKDWFIEHADAYILENESQDKHLLLISEDAASYKNKLD